MNGEQNQTDIQNQTPSAEDYQALKEQLEAEQAKSQELVAEATKDLRDKVASLGAEVATKTQDIEALKGQLAEAKTAHSELVEELEGAKAAYAYAVEDFKQLAVSANPLIPSEVIYGTTIEEVKASLDRANKLVANVQESLSKQTQASVVPAGAPVRTEPSTEGLSTKEKINVGLEQAKRARKGES